MITRDAGLGIYIHVPFCLSKCAYCDFYSICDFEHADRYTEALCSHIKSKSLLAEQRAVDSIYIGGGTPCLLTIDQISKIADTVFSNYNISSDCEFTIEANPAAFTEEKMRLIHQMGINRVSIGLQTANDKELDVLSRKHNFNGFLDSYNKVRKAGFTNVSVDLMYAIPLQTIDSLLNSVAAVAFLNPEHISLYCLKIEENTLFGRNRNALMLPDEDTQCEMYEKAVELLASYGYNRYEISNFSKKSKESRHNLKYWLCDEFLGFGPSAYSFFDGVRYGYGRSIDMYIKAIEEGNEPPIADKSIITPQDAYNESIMLGLRLERGIVPNDSLLELSKKYIDNGFMKYKDGRLSFTTKGFLVSNMILSDIIDL